MSKMIQLRNVPDDLHRVLKSRAALAGKISVGLPDCAYSASCRTPDHGRVTPAAPGSNPGSPDCSASPNDPGRKGQAVIVTDASAVLELLLGTTAAFDIQRRLFESGDSLHAPHLLDLEIAQVLRRYVLIGELTSQRGKQALTDLADLPIIRYPHDLFLSRIWALRHNVTAYDAAYLALAESLPAPLITRDVRLAATVGHRATIELVGTGHA